MHSMNTVRGQVQCTASHKYRRCHVHHRNCWEFACGGKRDYGVGIKMVRGTPQVGFYLGVRCAGYLSEKLG